ncbi:nuclear transport factor 2 family protein [Streptomyces sp. AA1529]|uniref:nuclear transport factor 2 family protein n=1 Tax=Streptomyces sp. AA1529 TaxID=1203257 RepID=UPI0003F7706C
MSPFGTTEPRRFIADFVTGFHAALVGGDGGDCGDEEAAAIVDRFHTPDVEQIADGHRMDRAKLVAHTRPTRKRRPKLEMTVHEALTAGDRLAARYTMQVRDGKREFAIEVCFFGRFAPDGRLRRARMLTRHVPEGTRHLPDAPEAAA